MVDGICGSWLVLVDLGLLFRITQLCTACVCVCGVYVCVCVVLLLSVLLMGGYTVNMFTNPRSSVDL